ncbi:conserved hypothetical protein [Ricinus communis]|uniref:Uncharacterized protein n=1 Tax=Ricinus communis TaxID=3988 RepID=B9RJX0_RICCO|nr:conserved hypothetical protein [Ricinus communis]
MFSMIRWNHRSSWIWSKKASSAHCILNFAEQALTRSLGARSVVDSMPSQAADWVNVNVDAAIFDDQSRIGVGCGVRDSIQAWLWRELRSFAAPETEAISVRKVLKLLQHQLDRWIIEFDALQVIQQLL